MHLGFFACFSCSSYCSLYSLWGLHGGWAEWEQQWSSSSSSSSMFSCCCSFSKRWRQQNAELGRRRGRKGQQIQSLSNRPAQDNLQICELIAFLLLLLLLPPCPSGFQLSVVTAGGRPQQLLAAKCLSRKPATNNHFIYFNCCFFLDNSMKTITSPLEKTSTMWNNRSAIITNK